MLVKEDTILSIHQFYKKCKIFLTTVISNDRTRFTAPFGRF